MNLITVEDLISKHYKVKYADIAHKYPTIDIPPYYVMRVFTSGGIAKVYAQTLTQKHIDDCIQNCAKRKDLNAHKIKLGLSALQEALNWIAENDDHTR